MSSYIKPSASLQEPSLGASASMGGTDVSRSSNGTINASDEVIDVPPLMCARAPCCVDSATYVSGADCSTFGVSRGSYADRLAFGGGKRSVHAKTKSFPIC
ncbi:hypothetical protein SUGI_0018520 [Cryptomeria japonica]|nr:hypothetical protein SUGI_0018520 [Cryptomeria japonica]